MATSAIDRIRVLLIDDYQLVRTGLRLLIERNPHMTVVGEATIGAEAIEIAARERPDIVLLDLNMGGESGLNLLPGLFAAANTRVILVNGERAPDEYLRAVRMGVMGLVRKEQAAEILIQAIEKVYAGETWLERALVARVLTVISGQRGAGQDQAAIEASKIARLTPREREAVALIGEGLYNKQIAERLSISQVTVSHHLTSIFHKLGLANRFDLVVYAYHHGLTKPLR
jgi:two-component system nitrate/nitrite response regulator NarL